MKPEPRKPKIIKVIEPKILAERTGYSRPHTVHCGPEGIFCSALGSTTGDGPRRHLRNGSGKLEILGKWEIEACNILLTISLALGLDTMISSRENGKWEVKKVIEIPAEPASPEKLPPLLKGFRNTCRHLSRTLICRSTTASFIFPAGGLENFCNTTCLTPFIPADRFSTSGWHRAPC